MADGFSTGFAMTKDQAPMSPAEQALREAALDYHRSPTRGKISVSPTKPLSNQRDLSLAYSPGVAYACLEIERDPSLAAEYTSRANLVGVITNGTAVLGLGDIGPLAGKPVMEGKGCLFKKFAGIDVFDIELAEKDPDRLIEIIAAENIGLIVLGLPINMDGSEGPRCQSTRSFARNFSRLSPLPIVFWDERLSTAAVERMLIAADATRHKRDQVIDKLAAAWILQAALDSLR